MVTARRLQLVGPDVNSETPRQRHSRDAHLNLVVASHRFGTEIEAVLAEHGLSMAQFVALWVLTLSNEPEGMAQGAIADGLLNRAADVSRLVDRLVRAGLAERVASPSDGRVSLVRITAAGSDTMMQAFPAVTRFHDGEFVSLSIGELEELNRLLAKALWGEE